MNSISLKLKTSRRLLIASALTLVGALLFIIPATSAEPASVVPAPIVDEAADHTGSETAILAGGCFWGVQGVFQHVAGVSSAISGYAGGDQETAHYRMVGTSRTGHAESVRIIFDPRKITYGRLLQVYFSVAHDPTQLNRQGPDSGSQYRSTIFPTTPEQAKIATAYIDQLNAAHVFQKPIVTTVENGKTFYPAEAYHQDFLVRNPTYPYIVLNDLPKVRNLKRLFPESYRADPVLVAAAKPSN